MSRELHPSDVHLIVRLQAELNSIERETCSNEAELRLRDDRCASLRRDIARIKNFECSWQQSRLA
jgi:hypothetical protein